MAGILSALILVMAGATSPSGTWNDAITASAPRNWYRLDEPTGATAIDYGSEELNGTYGSDVHAPARGVAGPVGPAVAFDGNRRNFLLGGSAITGHWTAEFILKRTGTKSSAELIRGAPLESPSSHLKLEQYPGTGQVGFTESFVVDRVFSPPVVAPLNRFIHLAIVRDGAGTSAYVDGALAGSSGSSVDLYRYQIGDTESESPLAVIDEVVIYDRALSAAEIAQHFRAIPEPASGVAWAVNLAALVLWRRRHR